MSSIETENQPAEVVTFEQMRARLELIQKPIRELLDLGDRIYDLAAPSAPTPLEDPEGPITHVTVLDSNSLRPHTGELTVRFAPDKHIRIDRVLPGVILNPMAPLRTLWFVRPYVDAGQIQTIPVQMARPGLLYDITSPVFNSDGSCLGVEDLEYARPQPLIDETMAGLVEALDFARANS